MKMFSRDLRWPTSAHLTANARHYPSYRVLRFGRRGRTLFKTLQIWLRVIALACPRCQARLPRLHFDIVILLRFAGAGQIDRNRIKGAGIVDTLVDEIR